MDILQRYYKNIYENGNVFIYGIFTGLVILIIFKIFHSLITRKKCYGITIEGEHGELFVTASALKDFVVRVLAGQQDAFVENVSVKKNRANYTIFIFINVLADSNVSELRTDIEEKVLSGLREKIGIENVNKIHITLKNFSANPKKISKRNKLISSSVGYQTLHDEEEKIEESDDAEMPTITEEKVIEEEKTVRLIKDES